MAIKTDAASFSGTARKENPGSTPVSASGAEPTARSGVGESVLFARASEDQNSFQRDAETHARERRAPRFEDTRYSKRRLPHFEKPWAMYAATITTRQRKTLSPCARTIVLNALTHFHNSRYELFAACIMPDHAHLLFQPWPKGEDPSNNAIFWPMAELMHSLKSFTAHEINKLEQSRGPVWEEEVFDRYIRSESDLHEKFRYICRNPWETKVVRPDEKYEWIWTREDEFRKAEHLKNPGSTPVSGVGESVPLSQVSDERSFQRDAETHARDGRAPQSAREARALPRPPSSPRQDNAGGLPAREVDL